VSLEETAVLCPSCGRVRLPDNRKPECVICFTTLVTVSQVLRIATGWENKGNKKMGRFLRKAALMAIRFEHRAQRKQPQRQAS